MSAESPPEPDLKDLDSRLKRARDDIRGPFEKKAGNEPLRSAVGLAFRVSVELVSALAVGLGIGWVLDEWLGTRPWLMILFILLGGAAGMLNVYRLAMRSGGSQGNSDAGKDQGNR